MVGKIAELVPASYGRRIDGACVPVTELGSKFLG
jgi:hypothetical protein